MINLIPPQVKKERKNRAIIFEIIGGITAMLVMLVIFGLALNVYNKMLAGDLKKYEDRIYERNKKASSFKDTETLINNINGKLTQLESIDNQRIIWGSVMDDISQSTPKNVQIKSLNMAAENRIISLSGIALDRKSIAEMKEMLEKNGGFANVTFSTSTFNSSNNNYTFALSFELKQKSAK